MLGYLIMKVLKAGCVLINFETRKIGLVYRRNKNDYTFPKGHLEEGETLVECALRETEEETGRLCEILNEDSPKVITYMTPSGEDVEMYFYFAKDLGESSKDFPTELVHDLKWVKINDVEGTLTYNDLKELWSEFKVRVQSYLKKV